MSRKIPGLAGPTLNPNGPLFSTTGSSISFVGYPAKRNSWPVAVYLHLAIIVAVAVFATLGMDSRIDADDSAFDATQSAPTENDAVQRFVEGFQGKGVLSDDSRPPSLDESLEKFRLPVGLRIEAVATEPEVMQPLSLSFDERGRMWVVQYRQYPFPAGLKIVRYDQYLRAVFDKVPPPPPNHIPGLDRVTVFEDLDRNGTYESSRDVLTGLNIATSVAYGAGGLWVMNPPYLLFYPDADGDAVLEGDPEVHLSGFGLEDTHAVANSLTWGPDGWLYGSNGSTTTANVATRRGHRTRFEGQCVWRYHPQRESFEIYAEGGGNTFSLEIDAAGRVYSGTNIGQTRGMYYPQGSYGVKNWGKHGPLSNPFAFGFIEHMRFEGDGDRFAQTFAVYEADLLPKQYHGRIIAANSLHNRVWTSRLLPDTSSFRTIDEPPLVETDDRWFRPVDVKVGPDGAVYLADWCDSRLSHVDPRDTWHKTSGRIYRIVGEAKPQPSSDAFPRLACLTSFDLSAWTSNELISLFSHPNKFFQHTAVRLLSERKDKSIVNELRQQLHSDAKGGGLQSLWTLYRLGELSNDDCIAALKSPNADIRRWAVRLVGDDREVSVPVALQLVETTKVEAEVPVRTQLASTAKRLPGETALPILRELIRFDADVDDIHQGLLIWWAFEAHAISNAEDLLDLVSANFERPLVTKFVAGRLVQRWVLNDAEPNWEWVCELFDRTLTIEGRSVVVQAVKEALVGKNAAGIPSSIRDRMSSYYREAKQSDLPMLLKTGDANAIASALKKVAVAETPITERIEMIELLGQIREKRAVAVLLKLLTQSNAPSLQKTALLALANYEDESIGKTIGKLLHTTLSSGQSVQQTALQVLASRGPWTAILLAEIEASRFNSKSVSSDLVEQMQLHDDEKLQYRIRKIWGVTRKTPEELKAKIAEVHSWLRKQDGEIEPGRILFMKKCGTCHSLFGEGGRVGPNLTGYERENMAFMVPAIVDPSAGIREEYTQFKLLTHDGRVLVGLLEQQDSQSVTIRRADNQVERIDRSDVESLQASRLSLMPDGLLNELNEQQVQDLFAYLTTRSYLPASEKQSENSR